MGSYFNTVLLQIHSGNCLQNIDIGLLDLSLILTQSFTLHSYENCSRCTDER